MSCFQLPPVKAYTVYSKPKGLQNQALFNTDENLWNLLQSVVLKTNHRQGEGVQWTECLNRLRVGEMTEEDVALLETRRLKHFPNKDFENACHAFGTNFEMDEVNMARVNNLPGTLVQSRAKIECPKSYQPPITDHGTIDNTKFKKIPGFYFSKWHLRGQRSIKKYFKKRTFCLKLPIDAECIHTVYILVSTSVGSF